MSDKTGLAKKGRAELLGYHEGYSAADYIIYCPLCGRRIKTWKSDGTAVCDLPSCRIRFAVIEK